MSRIRLDDVVLPLAAAFLVLMLSVVVYLSFPRPLPSLSPTCTPAERAYLDAYKEWWSDDGDMMLVSELEHDMLDTWREE